MDWNSMANETNKGLLTMFLSFWWVWAMLIIVALIKIFAEVWLPRYIKSRMTKKKIAQVNSWSPESDLSVKKENEKSSHKKTDICPKCSGKLREVNGKFGKFLGCSNYPKCRFTEKIIS